MKNLLLEGCFLFLAMVSLVAVVAVVLHVVFHAF
jgi:hypothetical protein